jgi:hypothetical protein
MANSSKMLQSGATIWEEDILLFGRGGGVNRPYLKPSTVRSFRFILKSGYAGTPDSWKGGGPGGIPLACWTRSIHRSYSAALPGLE